MRGRNMTGWITAGPTALKSKRKLSGWVKRGMTRAGLLPVRGAR